MAGRVKSESSDRAPGAARLAVFRMLNPARADDRLSRFVDLFLIVLIGLSVVAVVLESMPSLETRYHQQFYWLELFTVAVFSIEYVLRVWTAVEDRSAGSTTMSAGMQRVRFCMTPYAVIDLIAIMPFYLVAFGVFGNADMRFLRAVRLLRILKLTRYSQAFDLLATCCKENLQSLGAAFFVLLTVMLLAASGMYFFERESQPVAFGSIPAAMWWAFATLTTVGYGDVTPITAGGKIFGALITVVGVGMVALPTGILASGYAQQFRLRNERYEAQAEQALDDGVLSDDELRDLEALRKDLGIGRHTASQILDSQTVRTALRTHSRDDLCSKCGAKLSGS